MNFQERFNLITRNTEEFLKSSDLKDLLKQDIPIKHYIGFEISGLIHLGTSLGTAHKIKDLQDAGVETTIFLADWHTWINHKLGQDREFIKDVALSYFRGTFYSVLKAIGANPDEVNFVLGSDLYHTNDKFWMSVIDVADSLTLNRVEQMLTILGRKNSGSESFAKFIYPCMQIADHFEMGVHLVHSGTDQRKATVKGREVAHKLTVSPLLDSENNSVKPIGMMTHLIQGLQKPDNWPIDEKSMDAESRTNLKMSKSIPGSAIFLHESPDVIKEKIKAAFCPPKVIEYNPIIDWVEHIVFIYSDNLEIKRLEKHGGNITYTDIESLKSDFSDGELHPDDLKKAVAEFLIEMLTGVREDSKQFNGIIKKIKSRVSR